MCLDGGRGGKGLWCSVGKRASLQERGLACRDGLKGQVSFRAKKNH